MLNIANWQVSATAAILPIATRFYVGSSSSQVFINEVVFDPIAATDTGQEYIELRGDPGTFVPADAYLVLLDGDSEDGNGNIDHIFYIAGMQFGSNGYLVLRQFGSTILLTPTRPIGLRPVLGGSYIFQSRRRH